MECFSQIVDQLCFQPKLGITNEKQRLILQNYAKNDQEKQKKNKIDLFTHENLEGLFFLLGIDTSKIQFVPFDQLCLEVLCFMQGFQLNHYYAGDKMVVNEGELIIILEGTIIKLNENTNNSIHLINSKSLQISKHRNSSREQVFVRKKEHKISTYPNYFIKKSHYKSIQVNEKEAPKIVKFDAYDTKPYDCISKCVIFRGSQILLQKLHKWIQNKQKQQIVSFFAACLEIDNKKAISKFFNKIKKTTLSHKCQIEIQQQKVYLVYSGQLILNSADNQIVLSKRSIVYKNQQFKLKAVSMNDNTTVFSISMQQIIQSLGSQNQNILSLIQNKLKKQCEQRFNEKNIDKQKISEDKLKQPIFCTEDLKFANFQKNIQNKQFKYFIQNPRCSNKTSKRFRKSKPKAQALLLSSDLSIFLSNYPYQKTVQSQQIAFRVLKQYTVPRMRNCKSAVNRKNTNDEQIKKIEKQMKRLYYNDKVRRLKIKNIASKQIPNGHKKDFNSQKAEKQIQNFLLFKNIIEYPMNGISQCASKQNKKNTVKNLRKMTPINSRLQRKTVQTKLMHDQSSHKNQQTCNDDLISQQNCNSKNFMTQISQNFQSGFSFYCNKVLTPQLASQKKLKEKKTINKKGQKPSSQKGKQNNCNFIFQQLDKRLRKCNRINTVAC